jgi:hypothetical protein
MKLGDVSITTEWKSRKIYNKTTYIVQFKNGFQSHPFLTNSINYVFGTATGIRTVAW